MKTRKFVCQTCTNPCSLIFRASGNEDEPIKCPWRSGKSHWVEVKSKKRKKED
jgi:hypothetical protein